MEHSHPLPVVLVHGIRLSGTMWRPVADLLDRPVATPDLPGHGRRRGEPFTMDSAVEAVAEAIDEMGGRALLGGLSLGGYTAIATASAHPDRVAGLVAMGCTMIPSGAAAAVYRTLGRLAARDPERANHLSARALRRHLPAPAAEAALAGGLSSEVFPHVVEGIRTLSPTDLLATYPGPTWLVNGERDPFRRNERAFLTACQDGRLTVIPHRGHVSLLTDPHPLSQLINDAASVAEHRTPTTQRTHATT